jgi:hypothetical protein
LAVSTDFIKLLAIALFVRAREVSSGGKLIFENAETVYFNLDAIPRKNGSYSCGSSCGNEIARLECHGGGDVAEEFGDGEDEVAGGTLLLDDAVEPRGDGDR